MDIKITNPKVERITAVSKEHLPCIYNIASKAGWEDSFDVLERVFSHFGQYMKVAMDDKGQVLGHIFSKKMGINTVLIDLVMVQEGCRRKGIGSELMQHVMELYKGCVFCLTSYQDVNGFYTKLGFKKTGHRVCRILTFPAHLVSDPEPNDDVDITRADNSTMPKAISLAKNLFGHHVGELLECICSDTTNTLLYASSRDQGEGFIVFKEIGNVCKIRGFCAASVDVAKYLLYKCISGVPAGSVYSIGYLLSDNNFHKACGEILKNGTKWETVEDMMSTSEDPAHPFVWQNLYGIFQYYLILP